MLGAPALAVVFAAALRALVALLEHAGKPEREVLVGALTDNTPESAEEACTSGRAAADNGGAPRFLRPCCDT
ncbi:hypothetical protein [Saccharopolyspora shandongensis]|uniref:hypothetical protein n=1 Tax=Saccharopolyspora shandongensis TaxID=418495 RepID=UPI0033DD241D